MSIQAFYPDLPEVRKHYQFKLIKRDRSHKYQPSTTKKRAKELDAYRRLKKGLL